MPLSRIQTEVLQTLATHRDPESYVAGATPLNRHASRYSEDIDVFHDREERVAMTALADVTALKDAGYQVRWLRQLPLIYAAVEKAPGFTPEGLIAEIRRNANYPAADWRALLTSDPIDSADVVSRLRAALEEADMFVAKMPTGKAGLLFLEAGRVVQPDPNRLADYQGHAGRRQGHWPGSTEITAAMLEHYWKHS